MAIAKLITEKQKAATGKVFKLKESFSNDNELASLLHISKVTLYLRREKHNWTSQEILFIEYLTNPDVKKLINSLKILNS